MVKFKRRLKRFILYLSAFIAVIVLTAGLKVGVFFVTRPSTSAGTGGNLMGGEIDSGDGTNAISEVLTNLLSVQNAQFSLNLALNLNENEEIKLNSDILLSLTSGENEELNFENLKLNLTGDIEFQNDNVDFEITYLGGEIYATIEDINLKIETQNVEADINKILSFFILQKFNMNISLPDFSNISLDPSMLSMITEDLVETQTETGKELKFNLLSYCDVVLLTDDNYVLKEAKIENLEIENNKISLNLTANLDADNVNIIYPETTEQYMNFSNIVSLFDAVDNLLEYGKASGKVLINFNEQPLSFNYFVNFSDKENIKFALQTKIDGKDVVIAYQNEKIFVDYAGIKYYISAKQDVNKILSVLKDYAKILDLKNLDLKNLNFNDTSLNFENLNLKNIDFKTLIENFENFDLNETITKLTNELKTKLESLTLNDMFSILKNLFISENGLTFDFENLNAQILTNENNLESLIINFEDKFSLSMSLNENVEICVSENEFKNILDEDLVKNLIKGIENKQFLVDTKINFENNEIDAKIKLDYSSSFKAQIQTKIFEQNVIVTILGEEVYVEVGNILKVKGNINEILEVLKNKNLIETDEINIKTVVKLILTLTQNNDFKQSLSKTNFDFSFTKNDGNIYGILLKLIDDNNDENISISLALKEFEEINFVENGTYQKITDCMNFGFDAYDIIKNNDLAFNFDLNYENFVVSGLIQYANNEILLQASTTILGKKVEILMQNNYIFIDFAGLKIKYSLSSLENLIKDESLKQSLMNLLPENVKNQIDDALNAAKKLDLKSVLSGLELFIGESALSTSYGDLSLQINLENKTINIEGNGAKVNLTLTKFATSEEKTGYFDLSNLNFLLKALLKTIENKNISGNINATLNLFGEDNELNFVYGISFNDGIKAKIVTTFKGLNLTIYVVDDDVFINASNLKLCVNINETCEIINLINDIFGTNLNFDEKNFDVEELIKDIDFDVLSSIVLNNSNAEAIFKNDFEIKVNFNDVLNEIEFVSGLNRGKIYTTNFEEINFDGLNKNDYKSFTSYEDLIRSAYNLITSKRYDISAKVKKYVGENLTENISADVKLDLTSALNAFVDVLGLGEQITINYNNKVLYFAYGGATGLKISIKENAIQEILSIILSAMNVDTSQIPFLDEFLTKEDIDSSNISSFMPNIEFSNPLSYLEYIEGFEMSDNSFAVILKAEKLGLSNEKDVKIVVNYLNGTLTSVVINNLYIFENENEFVNIQIDLNEFSNITDMTDKDDYIDLSDSKDLIRALINTTILNDYHINGKIKLNIDFGISFDAATVDVDAKIKKQEVSETIFDEELGEFVTTTKTKYSGKIEVSNYPLITMVNNANTNGGLSRKRTITIYFDNDYIYLQTVDKETSTKDRFERVTKITLKTLTDNIKYYIQYLLGFTDLVQNEINTAIDNSYIGGETDYSNMLTYSHEENKHTIGINLGELVHNADIGTLSIVLTTINNESTQNKDYLYRLDVDLKLLDNKISLTTNKSSDTEALFLINIGETLSMKDFDNFVYDFDNTNNLGLDGEYEKEGNSKFKQANTGTSEIRLSDNGEIIEVLTGTIAEKVTLPILIKDAQDDGIIRQEYKFGGWFEDENFTKEYTSGVFPRYNTILFAKWIELDPKHYAEINFVTNDESLTQDPINCFVGDKITLPVLSNIEIIKDENTTILKKFIGWKTLDGTMFTKNVLEYSSLTLYAVWEEVETTTYDLEIISGGKSIYKTKVEAGVELTLPALDGISQTTKFYSTSNFADGTEITSFVVTKDDTVWYARNKFKVQIVSSHSDKPNTNISSIFEEWEGNTISLPKYQNFEVDYEDYSSNYDFNGYVLNGNSDNLITDSEFIVPAYNITFVASWTKIDWCIVTFDPTGWESPSWWDTKNGTVTKNSGSDVQSTDENIVITNNQIKIQKGTSLDTTQFVATCNYSFKWIFTKKYDFKTAAWGYETVNLSSSISGNKDYSGDTTITINSHTTLLPVWENA